MMTIQQVRDWLGEPLFLVPQHPGTKVPMVKYTQETQESTLRPMYQALLDAGNTAVRLGEHSAGFCAIDFDDDSSLQQFLEANPTLQASARWKGSRGAQIGVRILGDYPPPFAARSSTDMVEVNGRTLGRPLYEWRSTGNLSTVRGQHPSGCQYQVLVPNPPARIKFSDIRWPDGWPAPGEATQAAALVRSHGAPWSFGPKGTPALNPVFFAAHILTKEHHLHDASTRRGFVYSQDTGTWYHVTAVEMQRRIFHHVHRIVLNQIAALPDDPRIPGILPRLTTPFLDLVAGSISALTAEHAPFGKPPAVVHCSNGMVDLRCQPHAIHPFAPEWRSRNQTPIAYQPGSQAPLWQAFLDHALPEPDDQRMLRLWGGMALLQRNLCQVMLLVTGTPGGGKSTLAAILRRLVGIHNCGELRTTHLTSRFEAGLISDKTLLIGADVAPDFLDQEGVGRVKSLIGGDQITVEFKGSNNPIQIIGEWNVLVTANTRLKVKVQGDRGAWARRILILDFSQPKPEKTTPNYHDILIDTEGPGILSWFIQGAEEIISISKDGRSFPISQRQKDIVDNLMNESDGVRYFITHFVRRSSMAADCITSEELYNAYLQMCSNRNWSCEPERSFHTRAAELMTEIHSAQRSNHIRRDDDDQGSRGYRNVTLASQESVGAPF